MTPENRDNHVECPDSRLRVKYSTTTVGTTCSIPHEVKVRTFLFACWHTTEDMYTVTPSTFSTFAVANASSSDRRWHSKSHELRECVAFVRCDSLVGRRCRCNHILERPTPLDFVW